ncbi:MAG TPA: amidohydrolase family protein [Roseiflexaceae bacterium]|nr:amidohydrolase family protein [Roseiflexaceae bacterium]HMP43025.1 amidohydrolase family protein [Roseiflexaceae bacterium]
MIGSTIDLVLRNVRVPRTLLAEPAFDGITPTSDCLIGDLRFVAGRAVGFFAPGMAPASAAEYDLAQRLVLPRLVEAHCHLDKCHTVTRLAAVGGDLHAAIDAQRRDKAHWSADDIRRRAGRGLDELAHAGCGVVRTHIDWEIEQITAGQLPTAWPVLGELAAEQAGRLVLQRSALMPVELFADRAGAERAVRQIADQPGAVLGVFVFNQPQKHSWLHLAFELAAAYGLPLDFHVDEGLSAGLDGLQTIAELAIQTRFTLPVLCGHACSLANLSGEPLQSTLEQVAAAGLGIVSLPTTNLYLQDRQAGTPQRRGITRLRELAAAGIPILIGSDNVADAFCPLGVHDPLASLATAALTAHLDPPYGRWLPAITSVARQMLGLPPIFVDQASIEDLLVADAGSTAELVAGAPRRPITEIGTGLPAWRRPAL